MNPTHLSQSSTRQNNLTQNYYYDFTGTNKIDKSLNFTHIMKNLYSIETGEIIKNIKDYKTLTKESSSQVFTKIRNKKSKLNRKLKFFSKNESTDLDVNNTLGIGQSESNFRINKSSLILKKNTSNNFTGISTINNNSNTSITLNKENKLAPLLQNDENLNTNANVNSSANLPSGNFQQSYCPYCEHCNKIQDEQLEKYIFSQREAKSIISRSFEYLMNSNLMSKRNLDFFNNFDSSNKKNDELINKTQRNIKNTLVSTLEPLIEKEKENENNKDSQILITNQTVGNENDNLKASNLMHTYSNASSYDIRSSFLSNNNTSLPKNISFLNRNKKVVTSDNVFIEDPFYKLYPKNFSNNRLTYQALYYYLDAIMEDKVAISSIISSESVIAFEQSLLAYGMSFEIWDLSEENKNLLTELNEIYFDKELDKLFDDNFKTSIKNLLKNKNMANDILQRNNPKIIDIRKKYFYLFLVFVQVLTEIYTTSKEKALLLYKFFKVYFAEQEKKWVYVIGKFKEKISYYKNLCKLIIQQKNRNLDKIEKISDVLSQYRISKQNLEEHKSLIRDLLNVINEKRDQIYLLKSQKEILESELKFWIHDYDTIKLDNNIRDKFKLINFESTFNNIKEEMQHKKLSDGELSLLVNSDVYLLVSGHRHYFFDQKEYYVSEIKRLQGLYEKFKNGKNKWKRSYQDNELLHSSKIKEMEAMLTFYLNKDKILKVDSSCQTDVDYLKMNNLIKNKESLTIYKALSKNKLDKFMEKIKYNCSIEKPFSKRSLFNLIIDVYNEKIIRESHLENAPSAKKKFDVFFYNYMIEKFKLSVSVKKHCEETILSLLKYSADDFRVDSFRKFLGIGEYIRREILDVFLVLLKTVPCGLSRIFEFENYEDYQINSPIMPTEMCFEIFFTKFPNFKFNYVMKDVILKNSHLIEINKNYTKTVTNLSNLKFEYFLLIRFFNKSQFFFKDLNFKYGSGEQTHESLDQLIDLFEIANKDFYFTRDEIQSYFGKIFKIENKLIKLEDLFVFFAKGYSLRIKVNEFLEICYKNVIDVFNSLIKKIEILFLENDSRKNSMMIFRDFEKMMTKIISVNENKWKVNEYFM